MRTLTMKTLKIGSLTKAFLDYPQFEEILKSLSRTSFPSASCETEKEKLLFIHIVSPCRSTYGQRLVLSRRVSASPQVGKSQNVREGKRRDSSQLSASENDSLEIDLKIEEALNTLRGGIDPSKRSSSITPTKGEPTLSTNVNRKGLKKRAFTRTNSENVKKSVVTEELELREFLDLEKQIERETVKVSVNLGNLKQKHKRNSVECRLNSSEKQAVLRKVTLVSKNRDTHRSKVGKESLNAGLLKSDHRYQEKSSSEKCLETQVKTNPTITLRETVSKMLGNKKPTAALKPKKMRLDDKSSFLTKVRGSTFTDKFVLRLILFAWKTIVSKKNK